MVSTREETAEILDNLSGMSAELIRATTDAKKLKKQLISISNVVEDKRYEILSRFLSGTGAWKILNKVKAFTQTISELSDRSEARMAKEAKTLQGLGQLAAKQAKFAGLAELARKAEKGDAEAIAKMMQEIPEVKGLSLVKGVPAAIKQYREFIEDAESSVSKTIKALGKPDVFKKTKAAFSKVFEFRDKMQLGTRFSEVKKRRGEEKRVQESLPFYEDITLKEVDTPDSSAKILGRLVGTSTATLDKGLTDLMKYFDTKVVPVLSSGYNATKEFFSRGEKGQARREKVFGAIKETITKLYAKFLPVLLGFVLFFTAFFILYRILKSGGFLENITAVITTAFEALSFAFGLVWEGLSRIVDGFASGDFFKVLEGVAYILGGLAVGALTLLGTIVVGALTLVYSVLKGAIYGTLERLNSSVGKAVSTIFYIGAGIALLVAFFVGFPAILVAAVLTGVGYLIEKFTPFSKGGTVSNNGMQLVGEKGPELVKLPVGSRVFSNKDSRNMVSSGGTTNNITVQVTGRVGASDQEIKDIARKVSREIGLQMNRTGSTAVRF